MAKYDENLAMRIIKAKGIQPLKQSLINEMD